MGGRWTIIEHWDGVIDDLIQLVHGLIRRNSVIRIDVHGGTVDCTHQTEAHGFRVVPSACGARAVPCLELSGPSVRVIQDLSGAYEGFGYLAHALKL